MWGTWNFKKEKRKSKMHLFLNLAPIATNATIGVLDPGMMMAAYLFYFSPCYCMIYIDVISPSCLSIVPLTLSLSTWINMPQLCTGRTGEWWSGRSWTVNSGQKWRSEYNVSSEEGTKRAS